MFNRLSGTDLNLKFYSLNDVGLSVRTTKYKLKLFIYSLDGGTKQKEKYVVQHFYIVGICGLVQHSVSPTLAGEGVISPTCRLMN